MLILVLILIRVHGNIHAQSVMNFKVRRLHSTAESKANQHLNASPQTVLIDGARMVVSDATGVTTSSITQQG